MSYIKDFVSCSTRVTQRIEASQIKKNVLLISDFAGYSETGYPIFQYPAGYRIAEKWPDFALCRILNHRISGPSLPDSCQNMCNLQFRLLTLVDALIIHTHTSPNVDKQTYTSNTQTHSHTQTNTHTEEGLSTVRSTSSRSVRETYNDLSQK